MKEKETVISAIHPSPEFEQFRELILAEEHRTLDSIDRRWEGLPETVADLLPETVEKSCSSNGEALIKALRSPVEEAVSSSVQHDRSKMAAALFPILGPAIRLYVNELFKGLVDQLNQSIKNATSIQRFRWRWEAKRAGVPFSEYVILKTMKYRIDDILLVDPESGLLMQRVSREGEGIFEENPDLVSGMVVAIRSFAKETLGASAEMMPEGMEMEAELNRFSFGDHEIFVESGPNAIVAAIGSGSPPPSFRHLMGEVVENIHSDFGELLAAYQGDVNQLSSTREHLKQLLVENNPKSKPAKKSTSMPPWAILTIIGMLLAGWIGYSTYQKHLWNKTEAALHDEPGIEVLRMVPIGWGKKRIEMLKDPEAREPRQVVDGVSNLGQRVSFKVSPYYSLEPEFEHIRQEKSANEQEALRQSFTERFDQFDAGLGNLRERLSGQPSVKNDELTQVLFHAQFGKTGAALSKVEENWIVSGKVSSGDFSEIERLLPEFVFDGAQVDFSKLAQRAPEKSEFQKRSEAIFETNVVFESGESTVNAATELALETVAAKMRALDLWAIENGHPLPFYELHALPLIGASSGENKAIALRRLDHMVAAAEDAGIGQNRLRLFADNERQNRNGIYVKVALQKPEGESPSP